MRNGVVRLALLFLVLALIPGCAVVQCTVGQEVFRQRSCFS